MNRAQHIARAQTLLAGADKIVDQFHSPNPSQPYREWDGGGSALGETAKMLASVAAVHAQLAALADGE